jgi:hypothetical protein
MIRPKTLAAWRSLAAAYRFLYRLSLQDRLAGQVADVTAWHRLGGRSEPDHERHD